MGYSSGEGYLPGDYLRVRFEVGQSFGAASPFAPATEHADSEASKRGPARGNRAAGLLAN